MMTSISRPPGTSIHNGRLRSLMFLRRAGFFEGPRPWVVPVPALAGMPPSDAFSTVPERDSCLSASEAPPVLISRKESVDIWGYRLGLGSTVE
jgi:hypothetical protein